MKSVYYRLELRQRVYLLVIGLIFILSGIASLGSDFGSQTQWIFGVLFVVYFFVFARFGVVVSDVGIEAIGLARRKYTWAEITSISEVTFLGTRTVEIEIQNQKKVRLRAPIDGWLQRDKSFGYKIELLKAAKQAGRLPSE